MLLNALLKKIRHFDVDGHKYTVEEQIGEGAFAYVYKVKDKQGKSFALKKMICQTEEQLAEAVKEIRVLSEMKHKNVLSLKAHSIAPNKAGQHEALLLLPLYRKSLQDEIDAGPGYPNGAFGSPRLVVKIVKGFTNAIEALHMSGYRHGDFKPANILLDDSLNPILTDFGSVEPLNLEVTNRSQALRVQDTAASTTTASFRAPELFDPPSSCTIDGKTDVWGIGCTIYAMLFSRTPFENPVEGLSTLAVLSGKFTIPPSSPWAPEFHTMIQACLRVDVQSRLSIEDLKLVISLLPETESFIAVAAAGGGADPVVELSRPPSGAFANFAEFPNELSEETSKRSSQSPKSKKTKTPKSSVATSAVAGASRRVSFGEWQTAGAEESGVTPSETGEFVAAAAAAEIDDGDDVFEFGDFVAAVDTTGAGVVSEASPSKDKMEFRDALNSSQLSESSLSSLSLAGSYRSDMPEASKSGPVDVIRSRRSGLGRKTVRKQVWLGMRGTRIFLQKTSDSKSKVHMDAALSSTSSMRATHSADLSPFSAVLEGLLPSSSGSSSKTDEGGGGEDNWYGGSGNTLSVEVGFSSAEDLDSWLVAIQDQIESIGEP